MRGPWRDIWYDKVLPKIQFFMWTAVLEKISTMDALWRKGLALPSICLQSYHDAESINHLLIHCHFAWEIWCGVARDFGSTFAAATNFRDLLLGWRSSVFNTFGKRIWRLVPATVCWAIWLEKNHRVFKGHSEPTWRVYRRVKEYILLWTKLCKGYEGIPDGDLHKHWERVIGLVEY